MFVIITFTKKPIKDIINFNFEFSSEKKTSYETNFYYTDNITSISEI